MFCLLLEHQKGIECVIQYFYILKHKMSRSGYYSRRVSYKKPELLTLREHLRSPLVF